MFALTGRKLISAVFVASSVGFASAASAALLMVSDALGLVNDGIPSSAANEVIYINNLLTLSFGTGPIQIGQEKYTRYNTDCDEDITNDGGATSCTAAVLSLGTAKEEPTDGTIDVTGYQYLIGKYDAAKAGSLVWYVGGLTGPQEIPTSFGTCGSLGCGLSHMSLYKTDGRTPPTQIPEPGSLALLSLGLVGLALSRRRKSK